MTPLSPQACDLVKYFGTDDLQMRHISPMPFNFRVWTRNTLAGFRILDHLNTVPDQPPAINLIIQNAVAPIVGPCQRPGLPIASPWRRCTLAIQLLNNFPGTHARKILRKDSPDDLGFRWLDNPMTRFTQSCSVSVGQATSVFPLANVASRAPVNFLRKVGQKRALTMPRIPTCI